MKTPGTFPKDAGSKHPGWSVEKKLMQLLMPISNVMNESFMFGKQGHCNELGT